MTKTIEEQKEELHVEKLQEKLVEIKDYYRLMDVDLIYSEFSSDDVEMLKDCDIIRMNHKHDMFEVVDFEL